MGTNDHGGKVVGMGGEVGLGMGTATGEVVGMVMDTGFGWALVWNRNKWPAWRRGAARERGSRLGMEMRMRIGMTSGMGNSRGLATGNGRGHRKGNGNGEQREAHVGCCVCVCVNCTLNEVDPCAATGEAVPFGSVSVSVCSPFNNCAPCFALWARGPLIGGGGVRWHGGGVCCHCAFFFSG